jgi:hypothetical protein
MNALIHEILPDLPTAIDHIITDSYVLDLVKHCQVFDDHPLNMSEDRPVFCSIALVGVSVFNCTNRKMKLSWKRALANG